MSGQRRQTRHTKLALLLVLVLMIVVGNHSGKHKIRFTYAYTYLVFKQRHSDFNGSRIKWKRTCKLVGRHKYLASWSPNYFHQRKEIINYSINSTIRGVMFVQLKFFFSRYSKLNWVGWVISGVCKQMLSTVGCMWSESCTRSNKSISDIM